MKKQKFCYLEPPFPARAYAASVFIVGEEGVEFIYPLLSIYTDLTDLQHEIQTMVSARPLSDIEIPDISILIPLTLKERFPLKPAFWDKPLYDYGDLDRMRIFLRFFNTPEFYNLLVTPTYFDEKTNDWSMWATLPFLQNASIKVVEQFMLHSKHPVDTRAKSAAIYSCTYPKRFNWKTGEMSHLSSSQNLSDPHLVH